MKKRVISALVALAICLPFIYFGGTVFYVLAIVLSLIGLRELLNLITKNNFARIISYITFISIICSNLYKTDFYNILNYRMIGTIFLIFTLMMLLNYKNKEFDAEKGFYLLGATLFLGISFSIIIISRNIGLLYFIYLFLISCFTDIFAHLFGTLFGKHKINSISPNKTWEGALFGLLFGTALSSIFYLIFINSVSPLKIIIVSMFLSIIGQFGDLFFSLIKRNYGIKDFSNLMPGHGGVLDRLDNVIFVMLASTFIITIL